MLFQTRLNRNCERKKNKLFIVRASAAQVCDKKISISIHFDDDRSVSTKFRLISQIRFFAVEVLLLIRSDRLLSHCIFLFDLVFMSRFSSMFYTSTVVKCDQRNKSFTCFMPFTVLFGCDFIHIYINEFMSLRTDHNLGMH